MSKVTMADALAAGDDVILRELEDRIRTLEILRDEIVRALNWYAELAKEMYYTGGSSGVWELCEDRGRRAKEAIAKVRGENNE